MTGLVGIVAHARETRVSGDQLDALCADYEALRGAGTRTSAAGGDFARACKITLAQQASEAPAQGSTWALTSGVVHDSAGSAGNALEELDGQFAWAFYDAARSEFSLASDPMGMQALFIAERDGKTFFSTSALALARHLRARPSRLGLCSYLRAGYQFGAVTPWEGIERLDPGTRITFSASGPRREVYWRPTVDDAVTELDLAETIEHCTRVVVEVFRSHLGGRPRVWSDLTSGYDTRSLTLLLREAGVDFATNTVVNVGSIDARVAEQIARVAGWEWRRLELPQDWPQQAPEMFSMGVAWGDCHLSAVQVAEVLWGHREKAREHRSLLIGGGGEHFRHVAWQSEFLNAGRSKQVNLDNWVDMVLLWPLKSAVFAEDPTPEVRESLRSRMAARAEPYSSYLNTTQLDILHAYRTTGHLGAFRSAAAAFLDAELPFYYKRVYDTAISTNYRYRNNHGLMRHMIDALDPRIAAFPTSIGGPAQPQRIRNLHRFWPYYRHYGRKAITKVGQRLFGRALLLPPPVPDTLRARARRAIIDSFDDGQPLRHRTMRCAALFRADVVDDLLARAGDPNFEDTNMLGRILTAEMAMRLVDAGVDA